MIPRGVTYKYLATMFLEGWSMGTLAEWHHCSIHDIEHAIRAVISRERKGRG